MKKFFKEFKEFIAKGDVMSMAVGIIVGGAFTSIVNSLVKDIISPILGLITGGIDFSAISFGIGGAQILIGDFINSIITFLLTAFVLFLVVKAVNKLNSNNAKLLGKLKDKGHEQEKAAEEAAKKAAEEAETAKQAEEAKKAEEAKAMSADELELLKEIRDLLKERK